MEVRHRNPRHLGRFGDHFCRTGAFGDHHLLHHARGGIRQHCQRGRGTHIGAQLVGARLQAGAIAGTAHSVHERLGASRHTRIGEFRGDGGHRVARFDHHHHDARAFTGVVRTAEFLPTQIPEHSDTSEQAHYDDEGDESGKTAAALAALRWRARAALR